MVIIIALLFLSLWPLFLIVFLLQLLLKLVSLCLDYPHLNSLWPYAHNQHGWALNATLHDLQHFIQMFFLVFKNEGDVKKKCSSDIKKNEVYLHLV